MTTKIKAQTPPEIRAEIASLSEKLKAVHSMPLKGLIELRLRKLETKLRVLSGRNVEEIAPSSDRGGHAVSNRYIAATLADLRRPVLKSDSATHIESALSTEEEGSRTPDPVRAENSAAALGVEPSGDPAPGSFPRSDSLYARGHSFVKESVNGADYKAMFLLAAQMCFLSFSIQRKFPAHFLNYPWLWAFASRIWVTSMVGQAFASAGLLYVLLLSLNDSDRASLYLAAMTEPVAASESQDVAKQNVLDDLLKKDFYALVKVCETKYKFLRYGFWLGSISSFTFLLVSALVRNHGTNSVGFVPPY